MTELDTLREKVRVYEGMLHDIQLYSTVIMDNPPITHMIDIINSWSYAHRCGNGEISESEQALLVKQQFDRLKNREYSNSSRNSGTSTKYKDTK
jgi:hypothetical protein